MDTNFIFECSTRYWLLTSAEVRVAATSKDWLDSDRASISPPRSRRRQQEAVLAGYCQRRYEGYYMPACGYEFYLRVFNSISHEWAQRMFCLLYRHRWRDAVMLFSCWLRLKLPWQPWYLHMWRIKIVSFLDTKFSSLEKSWYFIGVDIIKNIYAKIYISKNKCQISKQSYQKIHENYWHQEEKYVDENHWYFWKWVEWVCCCLTWAIDAFHKSGVILKLTNHHNRYLHDRETNVSEGILKCKWWITKIKQSFKSNTDDLLLKGFVLFIFSLLVSQPCSLSVSRLVSQPVCQSCVRLLVC